MKKQLKLLKRKASGFILAFILTVSNTLVYAAQSDLRGVISVAGMNDLIEAAKNCSDGDVIMLGSHISSAETLDFDLWSKHVTLDLNGYNLEIKSEASNAIRLNGFDGSLTVTNSQDEGILSAFCLYDGQSPEETRDTAAIRVTGSSQSLILDGITAQVSGGAYGPGIGALTDAPGNIIIRGSDITARGGVFAAAIGGGYERPAGNIVIESGTVAARGGNFAAAIGAGGFASPGRAEESGKRMGDGEGSVLIAGGNVSANGGIYGAAIGGGQYGYAVEIKIDGGRVTANGGSRGAGIGTGKLGGQADIYIRGGNIKAQGGEFAAGIGTGEGAPDYAGVRAADCSVRIDGGNVVSSGGRGGAGIGGGAYMPGTKVEIAQTENKTYVEAFGGASAAGVGGGLAGLTGELIRIYGGRLTARGGENAAGIGGGEFSLNNLEPSGADANGLRNIVITGGEVFASAGENAAAIGGGSCGSGSDVTFAGTALVQAVSDYDISIGAGAHAVSQGRVTIDGGNITVNKKIGQTPSNSLGEPVYAGEIRVVSSFYGTPLENARIHAQLPGYTYKALTAPDGSARVYLPGDDVSLAVFSNHADSLSREVTAKYTGEPLEIVLNEKKAKILSRRFTYFTDGGSNTFQVEYAGDGDDLRFEAENDEGIEISLSGLLTFPVQLRHGNYTFPVRVYGGDTLLDTADFFLTVTESVRGLLASEYNIKANPREDVILQIDPDPLTSADAVDEVFWKVTGNSEQGFELEPLASGEEFSNRARFSAGKPGIYAVTAAVTDKNKNSAAATFNIEVTDPYETRPVSLMYAPYTPYNSEPPEISAYTAYRISENKVYIDFYSNCAGEYFFEAVKKGKKRRNDYEGGYSAFAGNNRIEYDLPDNGAYEFYVVLEDGSNNVSEEFLIYVDGFVTPDIVPPSLTDFKAVRDKTSAKVSFTANKDGEYKFIVYENEKGDRGLGKRYPMSAGINEFSAEGIDGAQKLNVSVTAEDFSDNSSPEYAFVIEEYYSGGGSKDEQDPGVLEEVGAVSVFSHSEGPMANEIELSEDFVLTDAGFVTVGIMSDAPGEYFYGAAEADKQLALDASGKAHSLTEGLNAVSVDGIDRNKAYRVWVAARNESGGLGFTAVNIPPEEAGINIWGLTVQRDLPNRATINFFSDSDGTFHYALMRNGDGHPERYNRTEMIYEGRNVLLLDGLEGNETLRLVAVTQNKEGKYGNFLSADIDSYKGGF